MAFYNEKGQLYLEAGALGEGLRACLLKVRGRMWFSENGALKNGVLWLTAFARKSLTCIRTCYGNTEREALGIL